jgi:Domain of Unknown Function (DUF1080)/PA14 domain
MKIKFIILLLICLKINNIFSQQIINLTNLSSFKNPGKNWEIVGNVSGLFNGASFTTESGTGILHNKPHVQGVKSEDLIFNFDHGDINVSFDFMMPKGSNSGIYLQGQYEIQLFDSWGVKVPKVHDCGAIYERWDDVRGKGKEGFEGLPPRQNVSFAPGLWQHMEVSFLAPKFDALGKKIANAKFVKVVQNGFLIHENVELLGPTRGALLANEVAKAPIRIQGDHGEVAIKNFTYELLDKPHANLENITYRYYEGKFDPMPASLPQKITSQGNIEKINYRVAEKNSDFLLDFTGKLIIPETDKYTFSLPTTGIAQLMIDGQKIIDTKGHKWRNEETKSTISLEKGSHNLELIYARTFSWGGRALGLFIKREGTPNQPLHAYISLPDPEPVGLIEVKTDPSKPVLQRSFVYFDGKKRTHAINIGTPNGVNYSYDLERAALLHIWRGKFLNATEMWHERGEPQIAEPLSASIKLDGKNSVATATGSSTNVPDSLSVENEWIYKGYNFDSNRNPVFKYAYKNETVTDKITAIADGSGLQREINFTNYMNSETYVRAGEAKEIKNLGNGTYLLDNHYIRIPQQFAPIINDLDKNGMRKLLIPVISRNIIYSIIW